MDMGVVQPDGGGDSKRGTKKSSVINMSSGICSRKKGAIDEKRGGDKSRKWSGNSIPKQKR